MLDRYEVIQRQRKERNLLQAETEAEERYLHVLSMTYKETCQSAVGKNECRSIVSQINHWVKDLSNKEKRAYLLFVSLDESLSKLKEYIFDKYSKNSKKLDRFQILFSNQDYVNDCKRLMIHKIYDFKLEQSVNNFESGFVSPRAHSMVALNQQKKQIRTAAHEGLASAYKKLNGYVLPDDIEMMMYQTFEKVVQDHIKGNFKTLRMGLKQGSADLRLIKN